MTLRETLAARLRPHSARTSARRDVWALRDIDLEIEEGDTVGIVGRNGAGKTTFLKTVARIVRPTTGVVSVRGRVGAMLEVGTAFHPELTGRENVFLNGVVLGMTRREVRERFDDIVEFAGVERFLDTPLKRYSSGMYLRLAFSVAAHLEPDVVIVDEVLAMGDAEFQRRCIGRMSEFGREGRTVLFVSHDSGAVAQLCRRAVWLEQGKVEDDGTPQDVLSRYLGTLTAAVPEVRVEGGAGTPIRHVSLAVVNADGTAAPPRRDEPLAFEVRFATSVPMVALDVSVYLLDRQGVQVLNERLSDGRTFLSGPPGEFAVRLAVPPVLAAGDYTVGVALSDEYEWFFRRELLSFALLPLAEDRDESIRRTRSVQPPVEWVVEDQSPETASA